MFCIITAHQLKAAKTMPEKIMNKNRYLKFYEKHHVKKTDSKVVFKRSD